VAPLRATAAMLIDRADPCGTLNGSTSLTFPSARGSKQGRLLKMTMERWWTPDTIFVTVMGAVMAVVLSASLYVRPFVSKTGSALVPAGALQKARDQQTECETMTNDMDRSMHANTHC